MPKLLIVSNVPSMLREFLLPYGEHFKNLGWQVDAMVSDATTDADNFEKTEDVFGTIWRVEWSRNPLDPRNFIKAPQAIQAVQEKGGYDIVHVHTPVAAFLTRYALRHLREQGKPKLIYTAHGFHFHREGGFIKNQIYKILEKTAGRWTDYLVVINREDEEAAKRFRIVPAEKVRYMPGIGVDREKYSGTGILPEQILAVRKELNVAESDKIILMIAEFNPGKRHRDALNALAKLDRTNVKLVLAGVGPLENDVAAQANALGLSEQVRFLGYRRDVPVLLKAAHALLLPSEREGLPRSILEAMCMGIPVISTRIRGVADLLEENAGIMTSVGDTDAIAEAMGWIADSPEAALAMGKRGQEKMKFFSLENVIRMHEALYAEALGTNQ
ncbi:MAG: glycosyltransferase [Burkholderiales bacterium]|nr:glycosyltransferase [Burkholderiales bacterium]